MKTLKNDMYRASGATPEYAGSGRQMPKELLEYFMKKKKAARGMRTPMFQGSGAAPDAAVEEAITNFFLNPEAGFQQGQKGKYGAQLEPGSAAMFEQLPTYEDFFRKEKGYYPAGSAELPMVHGDTFRVMDLAGADPALYYTNIEAAGDVSGIYRGTVDRGAGTGRGPGHQRFEVVDDIRKEQSLDPRYHGSRFQRTGKGYDELRSAVQTSQDVDEMNRKYAEFMKSVQLQPQREGAQLVPTAGGFKLVGTQSQIDAR